MPPQKQLINKQIEAFSTVEPAPIQAENLPSSNEANTTVDPSKNVNTPEMISVAASDYFKQAGTLRRRLLMTILPIVLVPLVVASAIGFNVTQRRAKEKTLSNIETSVVLASEGTQQFIQDALKATDLLSANPMVIQALRSGSEQVESQGLSQKPIEQIETQFADTKLLQPEQNLNNYLKAVAKNANLAEIILTERYGFNVAYSSLTSDFIQNDEEWWQLGKKRGQLALEPEFDESTKTAVLVLVNTIKDSNSSQLLGVTKVGAAAEKLNEELTAAIGAAISRSQQIQIVDVYSRKPLNTIAARGKSKELGELIGGQPVAEAADLLNKISKNLEPNPQEAVLALERKDGIYNVSLRAVKGNKKQFILSFELNDKLFKLKAIPGTDLVAIASVERTEVTEAGHDLIMVFTFTAILLGVGATGLILLLARQLSQPLSNLTEKAQQVADGNLEVKAKLEGTIETLTLAANFNNLVDRVKSLLQNQEAIAQEQRQLRETLEKDIDLLIDEVEGAMNGDLTVRASLASMEMSTVADIFNAIIDNLKDIAIQVKQSASQVSSSLSENEQSICLLAKQASGEAEKTINTLGSVEQMSHSIEEVAKNASRAAAIADDAYSTVQESSSAMEQTVNSILNLRTTVGETGKKMKRLGESSQKISQVVSLIEEIALKTNLLAINASVEASRAGEQGQGFRIVAEQVGALAEQSAAATKDIARVVAAIQAETQDVSEAMELGTAQVVDSTHLVESTKQRLQQVLQRSQDINQLMKSISQATVSQAETSRNVTDLMQEMAQLSEQRSLSSGELVLSMQTTARVATELESTVAQFKVDDSK